MEHVAKAIRDYGQSYGKGILRDLENYVRTGDEKSLKKLRKQKQRYGGGYLIDGLPTRTPAFAEEETRLARAMCRLGFADYFSGWLNQRMDHERPEEDYTAALRAAVVPAEMNLAAFAAIVAGMRDEFVRDDRPTSAGRFLLSLAPAELKKGLAGVERTAEMEKVAELLARFAPERMEAVLDELLRPCSYAGKAEVYAAILRVDGGRFERRVLADFEKTRASASDKFEAMRAIRASNPAKHAERALAVVRANLKAGQIYPAEVGPWLAENYGEAALPDLLKIIKWKEVWGLEEMLGGVVKALGPRAVDVVLAALAHEDADVRLAALGHLVALDGSAGTHGDRIYDGLRKGFAEKEAKDVVAHLQLGIKWDARRVTEDAWKLVEHKSKTVRDAAARTLAKAAQGGDAGVIPRAVGLLAAKKADTRLAAVTLLSAAGGADAEAALETRVDAEENDDVRDAILLALQAARERTGKKATRADVQAAIERARKRIEKPPRWADLKKLPPLEWKDGGQLTPEQVQYLLYRQSRAKEIAADVEARPMYDLIDPASSGAFAKAVLQGFLASKQESGDRWALAIAGLLGDDGIVPIFSRAIREWVDKNRGKLAEYAVQGLALLGSDAALLAVDAMAIRYRNKMKNVGRAAAEAFDAAARKRGITPEELGDRVVPWLGFEPGKKRVIDAGKSRIEVTIGPDFKLAFKDAQSGKWVKALPKTLPKETLAEFKDIAANLREVAKAQRLRLETLLVRQRRWPASRWRELFLQHPLLIPFATTLAWGHYDEAGKLLGTFRALEDLSLTTPTDDELVLPETGQIGLLHPLELDEPTRDAWRQHVADYNLEPPIPQMDRPVVTVPAKDREKRRIDDFDGKELNAMTFRSRAEKRGWHRGSVADAGMIMAYHKSYPAAGVDALVGVDGLYIGIDMDESVTLQDAFFVKGGSVKIGSYEYDEPADDMDERVLAFKDVPPIVYSETIADLRAIAGAGAGEEEE